MELKPKTTHRREWNHDWYDRQHGTEIRLEDFRHFWYTCTGGFCWNDSDITDLQGSSRVTIEVPEQQGTLINLSWEPEKNASGYVVLEDNSSTFLTSQIRYFGNQTAISFVKNFEETAGKRNQKELWRYRALVGGFYIFKHEYIFVFKKK